MSTTNEKLDVTQSTKIDFESINDILIKVFKHDSFRTELQKNAVVETCKFTNDIFVSLPTGSGKSLIYQLPAIYKNYGITIVVSPLLALMNNQIMHAEKFGIPSASINSHRTKSQNTQVKEELKKKNPHLRLLYLTPETLCSDHFRPHLRALHKSKCLKMFAIDEAHCVSSWGHEFRPDYLKLGQLRAAFPDIPIVALTATATEKVYTDIVQILQLKDPKCIIASTFRKNLFYDVIPADELTGGVLTDLTSLICDCLGIKKLEKKPKPRIETAKRRKLDDLNAGKPASSSSQFVSAASLLFDDRIVVKKSNPPKKVSVSKANSSFKGAILAKETPKLTSFFKVKVPEVIDLCSDGEESCQDKGDRKRTKSPEILDKPASKGVGIVYCRTKLACEDVATYLNRKGVKAQPYHSGLTSKERCEIEKLWIDEKVQVICATISFGMGIDKANVRVVVHYNMSQSLANYYQESGRAGRDGLDANCRLYFSKEDYNALMFLLKKDLELEKDGGRSAGGFNSRKRDTALAALDRFERMVKYCKSNDRCRHLVLASEFSLVNESSFLMNGCGESCDYCVRSRFSGKKKKKM